MSKFVNELLGSIYQHKDNWRPYVGNVEVNGYTVYYRFGLQRENIIIFNYGNGAIFSVIDVLVGGKKTLTTYSDRYKLENAVKWWYKNVDLETLSK